MIKVNQHLRLVALESQYTNCSADKNVKAEDIIQAAKVDLPKCDLEFANLLVAIAAHAKPAIQKKILDGFGGMLKIIGIAQKNRDFESQVIWSRLGFMTNEPILDNERDEPDLTIV
jgi:hypothetical protein